jgi:hypothetical protein
MKFGSRLRDEPKGRMILYPPLKQQQRETVGMNVDQLTPIVEFLGVVL